MTSSAIGYKREMYTLRSLMLVEALKDHRDLKIVEHIRSYEEAAKFTVELRHELLIDEKSWNYIEECGYPPHYVFCHPDVLGALPQSSLYYRGITGLSLKAVQQLAHSVLDWENNSSLRSETGRRCWQ